jgi:hypothetical protein
MRKEVILAVIIGVLLGGVILYGINLANNSAKSSQEDQKQSEQVKEKTPNSPITATNKISIITPQDHSVVTESTITLKGSAKPNQNIAIVSESDDILTVSDEKGNFSSNINLISGENTITITVVDDKQATASSKISVIRTATIPE